MHIYYSILLHVCAKHNKSFVSLGAFIPNISVFLTRSKNLNYNLDVTMVGALIVRIIIMAYYKILLKIM